MAMMIFAFDASAQQRGRGRSSAQNNKQQVEMMVKRFDLSKQQADQLEHLYEERSKPMESMRKQNRGNREAMRRQMEQDNLAFENRMKGILSPDQYKQYEKWQKKEAKNRKDGGFGQRGEGRPGQRGEGRYGQRGVNAFGMQGGNMPGMRGDGESWERGPKHAHPVVVVYCCNCCNHKAGKAKRK